MARALFLSACLMSLAAFGCKSEKPAVQAPPPPEVTVAAPAKKQITRYLEYTGRIAAQDEVEIRARVQGFVDKIHYKDGQRVEAGALLMTIDPRPFQAEVDRAEAELKGADAQLAVSEAQFKKIEDAAKNGVAPPFELLNRQATRDRDAAQVQIAKARLDAAKINLAYTEVKAPVSGKVRRADVGVGSLVNTGALLTSIVNDDKVFAYFNLSSNDFLTWRKKEGTSGQVPVFVGLENETGYPHEGIADYAANRIAEATSTIEIRAVFENKDRILTPGLFARVRVPVQTSDSLLVPEAAVQADQLGRYVLTVDASGTVQRRPVRVTATVDGFRPIEEGLTGDEQVIVRGLLRARPGGKVTPVTAK